MKTRTENEIEMVAPAAPGMIRMRALRAVRVGENQVSEGQEFDAPEELAAEFERPIESYPNHEGYTNSKHVRHQQIIRAQRI